MIDIPSGIGAGVGKQLFNHIRRHLFQQVRRIVGHQIIDNIGRLFIRKGSNYRLLVFHLQIRKHIRRHVFGKNAENLKHFFFFQFFHNRRNICVIQFRQPLPQAGILLGIQ